MKGYVIKTRTAVEKHMVEETLHDHGLRYEVWRTREHKDARFFHYWGTCLDKIYIKISLFKKAFSLFREERRKKRVATL